VNAPAALSQDTSANIFGAQLPRIFTNAVNQLSKRLTVGFKRSIGNSTLTAHPSEEQLQQLRLRRRFADSVPGRAIQGFHVFQEHPGSWEDPLVAGSQTPTAAAPFEMRTETHKRRLVQITNRNAPANCPVNDVFCGPDAQANYQFRITCLVQMTCKLFKQCPTRAIGQHPDSRRGFIEL